MYEGIQEIITVLLGERNINQVEATEIMEAFLGLERQQRRKLLPLLLEGLEVEVITPVVHVAALQTVMVEAMPGQMLALVQAQLQKQMQERVLGEVDMEVENQAVTQTRMLLLLLLRTLRLELMVAVEEMDLEAYDLVLEEERGRLVQALVLLPVQMLNLVQAAAVVVQVIMGVVVVDQEDVVQSLALELMLPLVLLQQRRQTHR